MSIEWSLNLFNRARVSITAWWRRLHFAEITLDRVANLISLKHCNGECLEFRYSTFYSVQSSFVLIYSQEYGDGFTNRRPLFWFLFWFSLIPWYVFIYPIIKNIVSANAINRSIIIKLLRADDNCYRFERINTSRMFVHKPYGCTICG